MPKVQYQPGCKMYDLIINEIKSGVYESDPVMKKLGCSRSGFIKVLSYYLMKLQKKESEILDKINKDELEVEDFSPAPDDEKDMPSLGFESLIEFEKEKKYEP